MRSAPSALQYAEDIDRIAGETEALVRATLRRGIAATARLAEQILDVVRGMVILESVGPTLDALAADPPKDATLLSALVAGMVTGDLLGRAQVVREVEGQGFGFAKPVETAFAERIEHGAWRRTQTLGALRFALGDVELEPLDPVEAIALFRDKVPMTTQAFGQLTEAYRARAFTIAGQETARAVAVVQGWLDQVLARGLTMRDFLAGLEEAADAGGITAVNPYHAETVFNTNIQTAYNAGRWEMYHAPEVAEAFPFFQYHTVGDDRVRPAHAAMDGFIARRDDPVWDEWWPPNGFNCRCTVTAISIEEAEAKGIRPSRRAVPQPDPGFAGNAAKAIREV
jgi:SPP1 gp7 family putative phage head morphogenesis protein